MNFGLRPAISVNSEVGVKADIGAHTRATLALFYVDTEDDIVNGPQIQPGRNTFVNAAKTNRKGVELALATTLGAGFSGIVAFTGGNAMRPIAVSDMMREADETAWSQTVDRRQAASPQGSYLVTSLLKGVVDRGTGVKARMLGVQGPVAGKTGTTDGYRDAWFIGYTPDMVIGVWVGFDDERPIKLTGAQAALPMWSELAVKLFRPDQADFEAPEGLVERRIDPQTGQLATSQCPEKVSEVFIEGTEPTVYCEVHGGGLWERLKQTFGFF